MLLVQRSETWRSGSQRGAGASSSNQCQEQLQAESQRLKAVGGPLQSARKSGSQMLQTGGQAKPRPHRRPSGRTRRPCLSSPRHSAERSSAAKTLLTCVRPPGPIGQSVLSRDRPGSSQYFDMLRGSS